METINSIELKMGFTFSSDTILRPVHIQVCSNADTKTDDFVIATDTDTYLIAMLEPKKKENPVLLKMYEEITLLYAKCT